MIVADTNVIAALFIRTVHSDRALALSKHDPVWRTDPFALVEFSNVLATYERAGYLTKAEAIEQLRLAEEFLKPQSLAFRQDTQSWVKSFGEFRGVAALLYCNFQESSRGAKLQL